MTGVAAGAVAPFPDGEFGTENARTGTAGAFRGIAAGALALTSLPAGIRLPDAARGA